MPQPPKHPQDQPQSPPPDPPPKPSPANPHRDLFRGSLEVLLLSTLADSPQYGYAIQKQLKLATNHDLAPATLYPLLHRLEAQDLITHTLDTSAARPRKWYVLTPAGKAALRHDAAHWQATIARLQSVVLPALRRITPGTPGSGPGTGPAP